MQNDVQRTALKKQLLPLWLLGAYLVLAIPAWILEQISLRYPSLFYSYGVSVIEMGLVLLVLFGTLILLSLHPLDSNRKVLGVFVIVFWLACEALSFIGMLKEWGIFRMGGGPLAAIFLSFPSV